MTDEELRRRVAAVLDNIRAGVWDDIGSAALTIIAWLLSDDDRDHDDTRHSAAT